MPQNGSALRRALIHNRYLFEDVPAKQASPYCVIYIDLDGEFDGEEGLK